MTFSRLARPILLLVAVLAFTGCASFERDWRAAAAPAARTTAKADPFSGRWDGRWTSAKHRTSSGYAGGRLRCLLSKVDERHYEARFKANWMVFTSTYRTVFEVERRGSILSLDGQHRLSSIFGGMYRYRGKVTPTQFSATYDSAYDAGTFEMTRAQSGR